MTEKDRNIWILIKDEIIFVFEIKLFEIDNPDLFFGQDSQSYTIFRENHLFHSRNYQYNFKFVLKSYTTHNRKQIFRLTIVVQLAHNRVWLRIGSKDFFGQV